MKIMCSNNCNPARHGNVDFRLVGVPIAVNEDLAPDVDRLHTAILNTYKKRIPGAKLLCCRCHENAIVVEEY
jgi:hypothetical protein